MVGRGKGACAAVMKRFIFSTHQGSHSSLESIFQDLLHFNCHFLHIRNSKFCIQTQNGNPDDHTRPLRI